MSSWGGKYDKSDDPESDRERSDEVGVEAPSGSIYGDWTSIALRSMFSKSSSEAPASFATAESIGLKVGGPESF